MKLTGSFVAIVTPFTDDGAIDYSIFAQLINWHLEQGTDGIVVMGTTGESGTCSAEEQQAAIRFCVEQVKQRVPVIAGTAAVATKQTIALSQAAKAVGADACLIMSPPYVKPSQDGFYQHYATIAAQVALPQILYNVPSRTAAGMKADTIIRLAQLPNIIAVKEASADMSLMCELLHQCPPDFTVLSGDDASALASLLLGAQGVISVTANVAPKAMAAMCQAAINGDFARARIINRKLYGLHQKLFLQSNPIPVKWALKQMGYGNGELRLPLTPLAQTYQQPVAQALVQAGINEH